MLTADPLPWERSWRAVGCLLANLPRPVVEHGEEGRVDLPNHPAGREVAAYDLVSNGIEESVLTG